MVYLASPLPSDATLSWAHEQVLLLGSQPTCLKLFLDELDVSVFLYTVASMGVPTSGDCFCGGDTDITDLFVPAVWDGCSGCNVHLGTSSNAS